MNNSGLFGQFIHERQTEERLTEFGFSVAGELLADGYSRVVVANSFPPALPWVTGSVSDDALDSLTGSRVLLPALSAHSQQYDLVSVSGIDLLTSRKFRFFFGCPL